MPDLTFLLEVVDSGFSKRPIRKYPTPYLGLIYRPILTTCLCYSVLLITKDEIPPHLPTIKIALCVYFVFENIYLYVTMIIFAIPQNIMELKKQIWIDVASLIIRLSVITVAPFTFWEIEAKSESILSFVTVFVISLMADIFLAISRYSYYLRQYKRNEELLQAYRERHKRGELELVEPGLLEEPLSLGGLLKRTVLFLVFVAMVFAIQKDKVSYQLVPRIILAILIIMDAMYFLYSAWKANPMNERKLIMYDEKMNNLLLNRWYVYFTVVLYFDLVIHINLGLLIQGMNLYYVADTKLVDKQINGFKGRLGIPVSQVKRK